MSKFDIHDVETVTRVALNAVEILEAAVKSASTAITAGKEKLQSALDEMKKMRESLKSDRADADSALDEKFKA